MRRVVTTFLLLRDDVVDAGPGISVVSRLIFGIQGGRHGEFDG